MPSLIEKPWFAAVCIPIAILGTSALVISVMLSAAGKDDKKASEHLTKVSIAAIEKAERQLAKTIEGLAQETHHANEKHHSTHWSHDKNGDDGPAHWGAHSPGEIAVKGIRQSPINIISKSVCTSPSLSAIGFHYGDTEFTIKDNGHTIQVDCADSSNTITIDDRNYVLSQFHFHARSEHLIDGEPYPMELHFVHSLSGADATSDKSAVKYAVVGVMIEKGPPNPLVDKLWEELAKAKDENKDDNASLTAPGLNFDMLLPPAGERSFFRYLGSLTTPPCTENVLWSVMEEPIYFSKEQIETFTKLYKDNYRPVQRVNQRFILHYADGKVIPPLTRIDPPQSADIAGIPAPLPEVKPQLNPDPDK